MVLNELEDRLYTSTEVANVLGVSLRSVYRYLEDGKLKAEMKTATGRHRFTKQNILDFMSPQADKAPAAPAAAPAAETPAPAAPAPAAPVAEAPAEAPAAHAGEATEDVDWLSKFRAAAEKYKAEGEAAPAEAPAPAETVADVEAAPEAPAQAEPAPAQEAVSGLAAEPAAPEAPAEASPSHFYKSAVGGLKDIAQNIDKSAKKASLDYAFTMDAGLSLHKPIAPFSLIHAYVKSDDLAFFEKILDLSPTTAGDAQLCLIVSDDAAVYGEKREVHGLNVVSDAKLKADLTAAGKKDLADELT